MKFNRRLLITILASYVVVLSSNVILNFNYYSSGGDWHMSVLFNVIMTTVCWMGFIVMDRLVFKKIKWSERPTQNILLGALLFAVGGSIMACIAAKAFIMVSHFPESVDLYRDVCYYSAVFSIIIGMTITARTSLQNLKKSIEENEQMKQEMIQSQYETLKSQVNPHFLFNSLNTLTVMIPRQPDIAVQFVEQMSKVFRYSLEYSGQNTIDLRDELKVVRSYLFLNEQRYDGKLKVSIDLEDAVLQKKIITQSLLMLVENAIKHNEISNENPLAVNIYSEGGYLVVRNTLQRKLLVERSTNVGLDNIKKRYALATSVPAVVEENDKWFIVKIPLL